jgi:hypothetical protein
MELLADPATLALIAFAIMLVGLAKGGLAGMGALATPLLALALPPTVAAALLLPVLLVQDVVSVWTFRKTRSLWIIGWMLPGALLGVMLASAFAVLVDEHLFLLMLGLITAGFGLYRLWAERGGRIVAPSTSPGWVGSLFGIALGFTSQIAHAGGPPFQMWVAPRKLPHEVFIGTSSIVFAAVNWMKVPSYLALGSLNQQTLTAAVLLMPLAIASTYAGIWLVRRLDTARFYSVIYVLMVLLGSRLVWDGLAG